jgi:hypothetical protein
VKYVQHAVVYRTGTVYEEDTCYFAAWMADGRHCRYDEYSYSIRCYAPRRSTDRGLLARTRTYHSTDDEETSDLNDRRPTYALTYVRTQYAVKGTTHSSPIPNSSVGCGDERHAARLERKMTT